MKSKAYWEKRSAEELIDLLRNSDEVIKELKLVYDKSIFNINTSIEKLYGKFAKDNQVSMNTAMRLIQGDEYKQWRMSMEEYLKRIEEGDEPLQLELNVLAMRSRINRLECLQAEIIANATILAQEQEKTATKHLMNAFENSYYHTMYDFYKDKNLKALELMQKHDVAIPKEAIKKILEIPWSGSNYSKRIWKRQFNIANKVKELVARNIIEGKSVESLTREVTNEFGQDYRNALKTLIHTETAFVKSQADKEVYTKLNIKEYEFVATLDTKTSEVCRKLDGKHFKVDEAVAGKNYPPMHPRCRSLTIRYKPENYEKNTRTARDKDGNNIEVPLGMKYDEWHKKYIKNSEKGYNKDKGKDDNLLKKPKKTDDEKFNWLLDEILDKNIEYLPVKELDKKRSKADIIKHISGGDRTSGSCASLGFAYIGQRNGYDVLDFRGGESLDFFSLLSNLSRIKEIKGIKSQQGKYRGTTAAANNLLKSTEVGKEYYLLAGRHAAIVRKLEEGRYQYLELQSANNSGWTDFDGNPRYTLSQRFGCSGNDGKFTFMIEIDESDFKTEEFRSLLGFINTKAENQVKGSEGYAK